VRENRAIGPNYVPAERPGMPPFPSLRRFKKIRGQGDGTHHRHLQLLHWSKVAHRSSRFSGQGPLPPFDSIAQSKWLAGTEATVAHRTLFRTRRVGTALIVDHIDRRVDQQKIQKL
jgi:hypothetical protein